MNVYDFDKTIYDGDSTLDFYFFCVKKYPIIILYMPLQVWAFGMYILGIYEKTKFKERFYLFLRAVKDTDSTLESFWHIKQNKIKAWYKLKQCETDIIISASPKFLLEPICERLGIKHLIASNVDKLTGKCHGRNCYGEEKVARLKLELSNYKINEFYSDSLSDEPLALLAERSYIVSGNDLINWRDFKLTGYKKLKAMFLSRDFMLFLIIGAINTINGVVFANLFSMIFNVNIAFILGYITSLTISYLLNSMITFNENVTFKKYIKFCISCVPNFVIQNITVLIFYNILHLNKIIVYTLAAAIGVPVTFILLKLFAFRKPVNKVSSNI